MPRTKFTPQQGFVLFAKNKKRVSAIYQKTLGLHVVEGEPSHDLLRGDGYEIIVHAFPARSLPASLSASRPYLGLTGLASPPLQ
jgi:hypothetical protein